MPIKPENKARYPANWKEIRAAILMRAGDKCEQCKLPNGITVVRGTGKDAGTYMLDEDGQVYDAETGELLGRCRMSDYEVGRVSKVVLTCAHLDHVPENVEHSNLKALCQRCHLAYDHKHHAETRHTTRRSKLAVADLFE